MSVGHKDFTYFHRLEGAVRLLSTSTDSPRKKVEMAFTSFLLPIIPTKPNDSVDEKLCEALSLATRYPAAINDEGTIHSTMRRVRFITLHKIMSLVFDAYLEMRPDYERASVI